MPVAITGHIQMFVICIYYMLHPCMPCAICMNLDTLGTVNRVKEVVF